MKNSIRFLFIIIIGIILSSCSTDEEYVEGKIPEIVTNIEQANSEFDDYNTSIPFYLYNEFALIFSTNRYTHGGTFDHVNFLAEFYFCDNSKEFTFVVDTNQRYYLFDAAQNLINTENNEYGPKIIITPDNVHMLYFYASDYTGNLDLYFTQNQGSSYYWEEPIDLKIINTTYNEAYLTFNKSLSEIYFCTDSMGDFDIFKVAIPNDDALINWLITDDSPEKIPCTILNSENNDKCPYIAGNLMLFCSDREGGFGGFDLYYSIYSNGTWSAPVNFGPQINTEFDEYRPIAAYVYYYKNDIMIFSSNRPGGKGGFDLYYVGIPKMID